MIGQELRESVMKWASQQKEPFFTADVFENIEEAETLKEASDSLRKLFLSGHLARKKIDNVRYVYIVSAMAPSDFERCVPDEDQNLSGSEQVVEIAQNNPKKDRNPSEIRLSEQVIMQEKQPDNASNQAIDAAVSGGLLDDSQALNNKGMKKTINTRKTTEDAAKTTAHQAINIDVKPLSIPESFTLTLQTPGGLIITIASGANNGSVQ